MVKLLLSYGADVNLEDDSGFTALFYAIEVGTQAKVKVLIEQGADVNHKAKNNQNPLYFAKWLKKPEMANLLLKVDAEKLTSDEIKSIDEGGNDTTVWLLKIGIFLSLLAGIRLWIRFDSLFLFITVLILGIGISFAIPKTIRRLLFKNLLLGFTSIILLFFLIAPIGTKSNRSSSPSQQASEIDRSNMNYCSKHSLWYYKDGKCPKCVDEKNNAEIEKVRKKFNKL